MRIGTFLAGVICGGVVASAAVLLFSPVAGKHKEGLNLNGLTTLSDAAAEALATHKGYLNLDGLTTLSAAAAKALAKHKGELWLHGVARAAVTRARKKLKQGK